MKPATTAQQRIVDADHPWLGLESFTEATQKYFFGRDAEIADIFVRTRENPLTILYGQSGLGKTSLLGAGLIPKLKLEGFRPVLLRLRYEKSDPPLLTQVKTTLFSGPPSLTVSESPPLQVSDTLWETLHHSATRVSSLAEHPPILIFDQFEEAFTLGQRAERLEEVRALFTELADVIENRAPAALKQRFTEDRKLVRDYDLSPGPLRIVITLREDYLSHLEAWKSTLPSLMRNRMALHLLSGPQALDAVFKPGHMEGRHLVDEDTAARIVRFVANRRPDVPLAEIGAVPPLLSLVCDELNTQRIEQKKDRITAERVRTGLADQTEGEDDLVARSRIILAQFYERSFTGLPAGVQHFVEDRMVTVAGHRCPVSRDDAVAALTKCRVKDPGETMQSLVNRRLISTEERGGVTWFEITHDVLVPIVKVEKDKRLARQRLRRMLLASLGMLALLGVFGAVTAWALKAQQDAVASEVKAAAQLEVSRYNEGLGWMLRAQVAAERKNQYPGTLLFTAQAIGFDGFGRPKDAPDDLLRFIRADLNTEKYNEAAAWIANHPAYMPIWASTQRNSAANGLTLSPDGRRLALSRSDGSVSMWDFSDGEETNILAGGVVNDIAFHPNGQTLSIATDKGIRTWDIAKAAFTAAVEDQAARIAWNPGGRFIVSGGADGNIRFWQDGLLTKTLGGFPHAPVTMDYCRDNTTLAAAVPDAGIRVVLPANAEMSYAWNQVDETVISKRAEEEKWSEDDVTTLVREASIAKRSIALAIMPEGNVLVAGGSDGTITVWNLLRARLIGQASQEQRHTKAVTSISFRPDGKQFASASADGLIRLWSINEEQVPIVIATLIGHVGAVTAVQYAPGGDVLASAGADGSARLWDVSGRKATTSDLYAYMQQHWYELDASAQDSLRWAGGTGFANVPPDSLVGVWQAGLTVKAPELPIQRDLAAKEGMHFTNATGVEMLWCPAGEFEMGSPDGSKEGEKAEEGRYSAETKHEVKLTRGFWLAKYELTQPQWTAIMGSNRSTYKRQPEMERDLPMENISWYEAVDFCSRLTDRERAAGTLPPGYEYALPSEAQWEYACRAGTLTAFSFGNDANLLSKFGNYNDISGNFTDNDTKHDDGFKYTAPIGNYSPNPWGFYDMHGNVNEWCMDSLDLANADYSLANTTDPLVTQGALRVARGGGWSYSARICRTANRIAFAPSSRLSDLGFRPAVVPSRPPAGAVAPEK